METWINDTPALAYQRAAPLKRSGPGSASCVLAGITVLLSGIAVIILVLARVNPTHGQPTTADWVLGFGMLGSVCGGALFALAGIVTAIVGLFIPNRRKTIALIGLASNVVLIAVVVVTMALA